jgi:hypothetical protein
MFKYRVLPGLALVLALGALAALGAGDTSARAGTTMTAACETAGGACPASCPPCPGGCSGCCFAADEAAAAVTYDAAR